MENLEDKIERQSLALAKDIFNGKSYFYGQIPNSILRDPKINAQAKALFGLLHTHCFNKSLTSYPEVMLTRKTMSEEMGVSEVTIRSWIKELEKALCLEVIRQGYKKPNKYRLYPVGGKLLMDWKRIKRIHLRLNYDLELIKKLTKSLHKES
ncbi:MAG: helix-turn-helix domain-containing protein [Candidatus Aminicenantaceae bacterium]